MFSRLEISLQRGLFWLAATAIYWALIFYAWFDTRFQVFLWAQVVAEWVDKRSLTDILSSIKTLEGPVWSKLAEAGPMATPFMIIPTVMAILLFLAPFTIRSDNRRPVRGYFMVPLMIVMCYVSVSLLNVVVAAGMSLGLHLYLHKTLGPDLFMYLVHPVYLAYPLLKNPSGIASQLLYLAYVYSVISTPGRYRSAHDSVVRQDDEAEEAPARKRSLEEEA
ncbi:MAG: hypothetical protein LBT08_02600, partial [Synergistaceae bacterium]|nr:hypothetical protein [Synergistaceae bacterium]